MKRCQIGKVAAGSAIAITIVGGSALVALVNPLGGATAKPLSVQVGNGAPGTSAAPANGDGKNTAGKGTDGRREMASGVLDELVADGTITQEQADKIKTRMRDKAKSSGGDRDRPGHDHGGHPGENLDAVAALLGTTPADLRTALKNGKTLGALASEKGVDPQRVIDALVAAATTRIDESVAAGRIDAARGAKAKEGLVERITKMVNEGGHANRGSEDGTRGEPRRGRWPFRFAAPHRKAAPPLAVSVE